MNTAIIIYKYNAIILSPMTTKTQQTDCKIIQNGSNEWESHYVYIVNIATEMLF